MSHKSQERDGALLRGAIPEQWLVEHILRTYDPIPGMAVDQTLGWLVLPRYVPLSVRHLMV